MKKLNYANINFSKVGSMGSRSVVPVFENEEEFVRYNYLNRDVDRKKMVNDLFETSSDEEKWYYGEEVVMKRCEDMVARELADKQRNVQHKMLEKAEDLSGEFFAIVHEHYVGHGDSILINDALFASEEVARRCQEILNENEHWYEHTIVDQHGVELDKESEL